MKKVTAGITVFYSALLLAMGVAHGADMAVASTPAASPWSQISAKTGADYKGDGLAVTPSDSGARLHCVFQQLDGEATTGGLWLASPVTNTVSARFLVTATEVGRRAPIAIFSSEGAEGGIPLAETGNVAVDGKTARFSRPGLTEEYTVSMDGVRQDFIVEQSPPNQPAGELVLKLAVTGAQVEPAADGARLVLENSGRKIAYSRLRATDATGKELPARIEVRGEQDEAACEDFFEEMSLLRSPAADVKLAVLVNDADAVYPVRIDPTFSDANWISTGDFPGTDGQVTAMVIDGSGNLYIGGNFTAVGDTIANFVAKWNGSSWSALGSGVNGPQPYNVEVNALAVSGATLYVGGYFTTAGGIAATNIAQWNGSSWLPLGLGMNGYVSALVVSSGILYAGGGFTTAGGNTVNCVAQWDGSRWSALGAGMRGTFPYVGALALSGGTLYAGGYFTNAGGAAASSIAEWNGTNWSALGLGLSAPFGEGYVYSLAVSGTTLYAGGSFTGAGGNAATNVAEWNGNNWLALGLGLNAPFGLGSVYSLAVSGAELYAGGLFSMAGGNTATDIAKWNGTNWSALGSGMNAVSHPLAVSGGTLYAGGVFTPSPANMGIGRWNGSSWSELGSGMNHGLNNYPKAVAISGSTLYAGGVFTAAGNINATNIAQWNGSGWSALGSGMGGTYPDVEALAVSGTKLYAGGAFTTAGGVAAKNIAQWDGSRWSALGLGLSGPASALAVSGANLYVGGNFSTAGGSEAYYVAEWNGSSWSALGSGLNGPVSALAVSGGNLYAGGSFTVAGNVNATNIAEWNGSSWLALGSGISGTVNALAVSGGRLYAGGIFTTAGGVAANNIAQWNGSSWSALGLGIWGRLDSGPEVYALTVSGGTLYAGGSFTTAGGVAANNIAQWDGSSWSALGSGIQGLGGDDGAGPQVFALAVSGGTLCAGGLFSIAGTNVTANVAEASLAGVPVALAIITTNAAFGFTNERFGFDVSGPSGSNVVIEASTNLQTWTPLQTNALGINGLLYFSDSHSSTQSKRFYRALEQ
jgi:hypothetical protein